MTAELTWLAALTAGLFGSGHCAAMCGGIAASLGAGTAGNTATRNARIAMYSIGRIATYGMAGIVVGTLAASLGGRVDVPAFGTTLRLLTGLLMIAVGVQIATGWQGLRRIEALGVPVWRFVAPRARRLLPVRSATAALALGAMWGALPCGLVYTMLVAAMLAADPLQSGLVMAAFGAGTLPAVASLGLAGSTLQRRLRTPGLRTASGIVICLFGVWTATTPLIGHPAHGGGHDTHSHASHQR